jgi:hypothetical protein
MLMDRASYRVRRYLMNKLPKAERVRLGRKSDECMSSVNSAMLHCYSLCGTGFLEISARDLELSLSSSFSAGN